MSLRGNILENHKVPGRPGKDIDLVKIHVFTILPKMFNTELRLKKLKILLGAGKYINPIMKNWHTDR